MKAAAWVGRECVTLARDVVFAAPRLPRKVLAGVVTVVALVMLTADPATFATIGAGLVVFAGVTAVPRSRLRTRLSLHEAAAAVVGEQAREGRALDPSSVRLRRLRWNGRHLASGEICLPPRWRSGEERLERLTDEVTSRLGAYELAYTMGSHRPVVIVTREAAPLPQKLEARELVHDKRDG